MGRIPRRFIAKLAIAFLLFMQFAVAAYACPGVARYYASSQAMANAEMKRGGDCAQTLDPVLPNLCLAHCEQDNQAAGQGHPPFPLGVDPPLMAVVHPIEFAQAPVLTDVPPEFLARTTAPPLAIRFGVFRS